MADRGSRRGGQPPSQRSYSHFQLAEEERCVVGGAEAVTACRARADEPNHGLRPYRTRRIICDELVGISHISHQFKRRTLVPRGLRTSTDNLRMSLTNSF